MHILSRNHLDRAIVSAAIPFFREALDLEIYLDHCFAVVVSLKGQAQRAEMITRHVSREEYFNRPPHDLTIWIRNNILDYSTLDQFDRKGRQPDVEARNWYYGCDTIQEGAVVQVNRWIDEGNAPALFFGPNLETRPKL